MMEQLEMGLDEDSPYSPFRTRANTWPLPRPENEEDEELEGEQTLTDMNLINETSANTLHNAGQLMVSSMAGGMEAAPIIPTTTQEAAMDHQQQGVGVNGGGGMGMGTFGMGSAGTGGGAAGAQGPKKNSSRRNAWGNMSYADLITQAIQTSPEKRLTLSQIYDWMVQNVNYFKDKGDSNSSAGWKNSIRHNLSLHNRFMRVQNEGTGKSSWWVINPDAKPGKAARRRATSMETQKFEKKRGRVKKRLEAMKGSSVSGSGNLAGIMDTPNSPSSSISEGLDLFPESPLHHTIQLSPEFRPRSTSNASSSSIGRLSPIPAVESDMHDSQVPPLSPMNNWNPELSRLYNGVKSEMSQLNPCPETGFTDQLVDMANTMKLSTSYAGNGSSASYTTLNNFNESSIYNNPSAASTPGSLPRNGSDPYFQNPGAIENSITLTSLNSFPSGPRSPKMASLGLSCLSPSLSPSQSMDGINGIIGRSGGGSSNYNSPKHQVSVRMNNGRAYSLGHEVGGNALMRAAINQASAGLHKNHSLTSLGSTASQVMGHLLSLNNHPPQTMPNDLDMNTFDTLQGELECDVDQVIRHELSVDGNLDFNFEPIHGAPHPSSVPASASSTNNWVH